jgi:stage II sporulation protein D
VALATPSAPLPGLPASGGAAAHAYSGMPATVRVGLYYGNSAAANKATDSVSAYCESGVALSIAYGGYQAQASGREQALRWQQEQAQARGAASSASAAGSSGAAGSTGAVEWEDHLFDFAFAGQKSALKLSKHSFSSPYAASLGNAPGAMSTTAELNSLALALAKSGVDAQLAYIGRWVLLAGSFGSLAEAEKFIESSLAKDYAAYAPAPIALDGKYVSAALDGQFQFAADVSAGSLRIAPIAPAAAAGKASAPLLSLGDRQYRGQIELIRADGNDMAVVNILPAEEYLFGVVPREIQASSAEEALKAQAVAARTYTVNAMRKHAKLGFDLCNTQDCQVYGGAGDEHERSTAAVAATAGKIVTWRGSPAEVFYFSSSGGATEDVRNVWNSSADYPYLVSVPDEYESGSSLHYSWETSYTAAEIQSQLLADGVDIGSVTGVAITKTSDAGRATEVTISGSKGKKVYSREACRYFLDGIYSQMYTIASNSKSFQAIGASGEAVGIMPEGMAAQAGGGAAPKTLPGSGLNAVPASGKAAPLPAESGAYRFVGKGWGHGIGMSQEGAKGMAAAGFSYADILRHYFPGCEIQ